MNKFAKRFQITNFESKLSLFAIYYSMIGLVVAVLFALYYRWQWYGYFSPGFFAVFATWPYQLIGFVKDVLYFGLAGEPI